jgi:hypothetical protein
MARVLFSLSLLLTIFVWRVEAECTDAELRTASLNRASNFLETCKPPRDVSAAVRAPPQPI